MNTRLLRHPITPAIVAIIGLTLLIRRPEANTLIRAAEVSCVILLIFALLKFAWPHRIARRVAIGILALSLLIFICPFGGRVTPEEECAAIVEAAKSYDGVGYVWGGESPRGIDCSGIARRAYGDAALSLAWSHASPAHLRRAAHLWLRDQAAKDFENHGPISGRRIVLLTTLRGETPVNIAPGDVAIVGNGVHVLLYLGDHRWIQADPGLHRVHEDDSRTSKNIWINDKAVILRPGFLATNP